MSCKAHGCDWRGYKSAEQSFLPTEAQWEYAARGAEPLQYPWGNDTATADLLNVCWDTTAYDNKGNVAAHVATPLEELPLVPVNAKLGMSPFGLRGMAGNVWQWCRDTYHSNFYLATEASLPDAWNAEEGALKSERGGSWVGPASCLGFRDCISHFLFREMGHNMPRSAHMRVLPIFRLARSSYRRGRHPEARLCALHQSFTSGMITWNSQSSGRPIRGQLQMLTLAIIAANGANVAFARGHRCCWYLNWLPWVVKAVVVAAAKSERLAKYQHHRHKKKCSCEAKGRCLGFRCTASASLLENYV